MQRMLWLALVPIGGIAVVASYTDAMRAHGGILRVAGIMVLGLGIAHLARLLREQGH